MGVFCGMGFSRFQAAFGASGVVVVRYALISHAPICWMLLAAADALAAGVARAVL